MERLTDDELRDVANVITGLDNGYLIKRLATELQQLRAAKAADSERVVSEVVHQFFVAMRDLPHAMSTAEAAVAASAIATRVADTLAVPERPVLSEQDIAGLTAIRRRCAVSATAIGWVDDATRAAIQAEIALLDRLLSARPIPSLVREIIQRELSWVPAGRDHDEYRTRLAECLEALP